MASPSRMLCTAMASVMNRARSAGAAEGDPEAYALREGVGGHDADNEESLARIQPAKAREDRRVLLDAQ
jgi:hypothetical protein